MFSFSAAQAEEEITQGSALNDGPPKRIYTWKTPDLKILGA